MGIRSVAFLESCDTPVSGVTRAAGKNLSILVHLVPLGRFDGSGSLLYRSPTSGQNVKSAVYVSDMVQWSSLAVIIARTRGERGIAAAPRSLTGCCEMCILRPFWEQDGNLS